MMIGKNETNEYVNVRCESARETDEKTRTHIFLGRGSGSEKNKS